MRLLGKFFIFFAQKILQYISGCGVKRYCLESFLFFRTRKFHCISQVLVLNDNVRPAFYFRPTRNYTIYLRLWCKMILLGQLFTFFEKKLYCTSQLLVSYYIVRKAFCFLGTRKFYCISQFAVLSNIVREAFDFLRTRNSTRYPGV